MFVATQLRSGQSRAYGDTIRQWQIQTDLTEDVVLDECLKTVYPYVKRERHAAYDQCNGSCGWPFGLHTFYNLHRTYNGFLFTVVEPYCD